MCINLTFDKPALFDTSVEVISDHDDDGVKGELYMHILIHILQQILHNR